MLGLRRALPCEEHTLSKLHIFVAIALLAASLGALAPFSGSLLAGAAEPDDHVQSFDLQHSTMTVYVYKQGIFAFASDNHEISAPIVSGSLDDALHAVELNVDATKMRVVDPKSSSGQRDKVQANMLGPDILDVQNFPAISYRSTKIDETDARHWSVAGNLTLHGQTHPVSVRVEKLDAVRFSGSAIVQQSTFGITPLKVAGGTIRVKDEVKIEFAITVAR